MIYRERGTRLDKSKRAKASVEDARASNHMETTAKGRSAPFSGRSLLTILNKLSLRSEMPRMLVFLDCLCRCAPDQLCGHPDIVRD